MIFSENRFTLFRIRFSGGLKRPQQDGHQIRPDPLPENSAVDPIWNRDATVALPDSFSPAAFSNADWDRGISRGATPELILDADYFGRLLIKPGDQVLISPTDRRTVVSIAPFGKLNGAEPRRARADPYPRATGSGIRHGPQIARLISWFARDPTGILIWCRLPHPAKCRLDRVSAHDQ